MAVKVRIIGSRKIKTYGNFSARAKGYLEAFKKLGAEVEYNNLNKFHYKITDKKFALYHENKPFEDVDLIFVLTINPNFLLSYFELFKILQTRTKHFINSPDALLNGKNKFVTSLLLQKAGVATPKTFMITRSSWKNIIDDLKFPIIIKKIDGSRGVGVMKFDSLNSLSSFLDFHFHKNNNPQGLLVQEYIEESQATDYRVVVVNKKVILTMKRKGEDPQKNFRSNVAQGAAPSFYEADAKMAEIAIKSTEALGLFLAGVDIMESKDGYKVLEVNSTPFIDIEQKIAKTNLFEQIAQECLSLL